MLPLALSENMLGSYNNEKRILKMYLKGIICFISDQLSTLLPHSTGQMEKLDNTYTRTHTEELTWQSEQLPGQDLKKTNSEI